jgi:hypothetical protein
MDLKILKSKFILFYILYYYYYPFDLLSLFLWLRDLFVHIITFNKLILT